MAAARHLEVVGGSRRTTHERPLMVAISSNFLSWSALYRSS